MVSGHAPSLGVRVPHLHLLPYSHSRLASPDHLHLLTSLQTLPRPATQFGHLRASHFGVVFRRHFPHVQVLFVATRPRLRTCDLSDWDSTLDLTPELWPRSEQIEIVLWQIINVQVSGLVAKSTRCLNYEKKDKDAHTLDLSYLDDIIKYFGFDLSWTKSKQVDQSNLVLHRIITLQTLSTIVTSLVIAFSYYFDNVQL